MPDAVGVGVHRERTTPSRRWWFLSNFGILYGITLLAACAIAFVGLVADSSASARWAWLWGIPLLGLLGIGFTRFFTFPAFTLYLVGLRLARRRWPLPTDGLAAHSAPDVGRLLDLAVR